MASESILLVAAGAPTITVSATTSASTSVDLPSIGETVRIVNEGTANVYLSIGSGTQTATVPPAAGSAGLSTCLTVLAGTDVSFRIPDNKQCQVSAITSAGTATLRIQVSNGQ